MSSLLISEAPLTVLPSLAERIGLDEAIVLQQVHYLASSSERVENTKAFRDGYYWVFHTIETWQSKFFRWWSMPTVKRIFQTLTATKLLLADTFDEGRGHKRLWYRVNYPLVEAIAKISADRWDVKRDNRIKMIQSFLSDQNDPIPTVSSDQNDPIPTVSSDQNDPIPTVSSDQNDPNIYIYKRSNINKISVREEEAPPTQTKITAFEGVTKPTDISSPLPKQTNTTSRHQESFSPRPNVAPAQIEVISTSTEKDPWVFDPKMEELVTQLDQGKLKDLPVGEKKQLANYLMGDRIKLYRRRGWILSVTPNDISADFLRYVAWKELKQPQDIEYARNTITSYERDMTKWGQLIGLIEGWKNATPEEIAATASARAKQGSKEDLKIAIQSSINNYKNLPNNPFRRKNDISASV